MGRLDEHVGIVTGGAQGIGGATARRLAEEGARVLIVDIDAEAAERNAAVIANAGGEAAVLIGDVTRHADVKAMVVDAVKRWGKLTLLVNNAYGGSAESRGSAVDVSEVGLELRA